jgi:phosphotransferase system  glucose/maltose/N-acetylglucosamine-specific IIC component
MLGDMPRLRDPRAIAAGLWAADGAILLSLALPKTQVWQDALVFLIIGVLVAAITAGRFPEWRGRPGTQRFLPLIASAQTVIVLIIWLAARS